MCVIPATPAFRSVGEPAPATLPTVRPATQMANASNAIQGLLFKTIHASAVLKTASNAMRRASALNALPMLFLTMECATYAQVFKIAYHVAVTMCVDSVLAN